MATSLSTGAAGEMVRAYVEGWREGNRSKILGTLHPDTVIVESHGPTYRGIETIGRWIDEWLAVGAAVDRWDITSILVAGDACVFEWLFECTVVGNHYRIEGASVIRFEGGKIVGIREYRMTERPYEAHGYEAPAAADREDSRLTQEMPERRRRMDEV